MEAAIDAVKTGMGVNSAARCHCVPKTTLKDAEKLSMEANQGLANIWPMKKKRKWCATFKMHAADIGYGKACKQVQVIVEAVAKEKGLMDCDKKEKAAQWRTEKERGGKEEEGKG